MDKVAKHLQHASQAISRALNHPHAHHGALHRPGTAQIILVVLAVVVVLAVCYRLSLRLRPGITCRRCRGTGKVRGILFFWARAFCPRCGGTGMVPRFGTLMRMPAGQASGHGWGR